MMAVEYVESSDDDGNESSPDTESIESAKEQAQEVVDLLSSTSNEDDGESDVDVSIPEAINITPDLSRADSTNSSSVQQEEDYNNNKSNKKSKSKSTKKSKNSKNNKSNNKNDKRNVDGKNVDQDNEIEVLKASPVARAVALAVKTEVNSSDEEVVKERKRSHLRMLSLPYSNRDDRKRPARLRVQFDRPRPFMRLKQQDTDDHPEDAAKPEIPTSESFAAQGGVVVCEDEEEDDGIFWEIDAVLDYKYHGRRLLWLVSWKNCSETSWVHDDDLCDSAKKDAEVLRQAKRLARKIAHLKGTSEQPVDLCAFDNGSLSSWDMSSSDDESDEDKDDTAYSANGCKKQSKKKQKKRKSGAKQDNKQGKRIRSTKARKSGPTSGSFVIRRLATAPFKKSGGLRPEKNGMAMTFTVSNETQEPDNFLRRLVDGRSILKLEYDTSSKTFPIAQFLDGDNTYSLVAIKNKREKSHKGGGHWGGANQITLKYVQTNGPVRWDPQEELEKVADFQSLPRHKLSSRLELFLTPAMKGPSVHDDWDVSMFETIKEEDSYMGCGFIPHELVKELYSARKKYPVDSLQIRIFAPRIGVVKGMLTPKLGIQKIQIPPSMIKVGPSRKCQDPWAVMVVKTVAPSRYNRDLGKYFESPRLPRETDPNTAPAYQPTLKPLSDMYQNLFEGLGMPRDIVKDYARRQLSLAGRKHAHLMGVCDPTGKLPEGSIFVTGYMRDARNQRIHLSELYNRLFITRSPCLEPTDGRIVPLVGRKPNAMSDKEWNWLREKPFGTVIFARPKNRINAAPLPALIADGDLDGDLYFVLFDEQLLPYLIKAFNTQRMRLEQKTLEQSVRRENINASEGPPAVSNRGPRNWFPQAQEEMLRLEQMAGVGKLTGMMYRKSEKVGKESPNKIWDIDARAYAKAFKQSLDAYKHGNAIELPKHLEEEVEQMDKTKDKSIKKLIRFI